MPRSLFPFCADIAFTPLRHVSLCLLIVLCAACGHVSEDVDEQPLVLKKASFGQLPDWDKDNHQAFLAALEKSCDRIVKKPATASLGADGFAGTYGDWQPVCRLVNDGQVTDAKAFVEMHFTPWKAAAAGAGDTGLFTGYYEPSLRGAHIKTGPYQYPLRALPDDLVMVDLGQFRDDLKGRRIAGRVNGSRLRPYEDRAAITAGGLPAAQDNPIVWVDSPVDAFFLHIQGSGRVILPDGSDLRVGYAGQNGHPYYAIGRELIARGHLEQDEVSLQTIRAWLEANPDQANDIMFTNPSYVFFRELDKGGPLGGEGVILTPERSLAVDRSKIPYGIPLWVDIKPPTENEAPLRRLMVAQDTGGAIRGAVRGDVFWGYGDRAEYMAGHMKSEGRYWLLLPKAVDPHLASSGDTKIAAR